MLLYRHPRRILFLQNIAWLRSMDEEAAKIHFRALEDARVEVVQPPKEDKPLDTKAILAFCDQHIEGVSGILLNHWSYCLPTEYFDKAGKTLKVVSTPTAGFDHVPTAELKKRGIRLGSAPEGIVQATAQTAFTLALWTMRDFKQHSQLVSSGDWTKQPHPGWPGMLGLGIEGKTVGIVGLGRLGQLLIPLIEPWLPHRFLYTTSKPGQSIRQDFYGHVKNAKVPVEVAKDVDAIARESDLLFLCCSLNDSTRHMVNDNFLSKMKKTAVLVNIGRGPLVDSAALLSALKNGQIHGAGLDVIEYEWNRKVLEFQELIDHPRCVVLPHVGSAIGSFRIRAAGVALQNVVNGAMDEPMPHEVPL